MTPRIKPSIRYRSSAVKACSVGFGVAGSCVGTGCDGAGGVAVEGGSTLGVGVGTPLGGADGTVGFTDGGADGAPGAAPHAATAKTATSEAARTNLDIVVLRGLGGRSVAAVGN
jgi:hypothetical protein